MGFLVGPLIAVLLLPIGGGILVAANAVMTRRRSPQAANPRTGLQLLGWLLTLLGLAFWLTILVGINILIFQGEPVFEDLVDAFVFANAFLFVSTIPLAGFFLLGIARLIRTTRTAEQEERLDKMLGSVSVIGWLWLILGVVAFVFPIGLIPSAIFLIVVFLMRQRRAARQGELLWTLAIAAKRQVHLAPGVAALAHEFSGVHASRVRQLAYLLDAGVDLPDALDRVPRVLPEPVKAAVRVGWESGSLAEVLRDEAARHTSHKPVWHAVTARLAYLLGLLIVLQAVVGFLLYFIVPKFRKIFMDFGIELPQITRTMLEVSDWVVEYLPYGPMPAINCVVYVLILGYWVEWRPRVLSSLPFSTDTARILRALARHVDAGRPLTQGVEALARWFPRWSVRLRLARVLNHIRSGEHWSASLANHGLVRPIEGTVLASAERAGNLTWAMRELAENADRRLAYRLQAVSHLLLTLVVLGVGGLVFFFIVGMFMPLVKLITELSG